MLHSIYLLSAFAATVVLSLPICTECPAGGIWSNWEDVTSCTKDCGLKGEKIQMRNCTSWDFGCPCTGVYSRNVPCPVDICEAPASPCAPDYSMYVSSTLAKSICGNVTRDDDYMPPTCTMQNVLDTCPCPDGGIWSDWTSSDQCTANCGLCGTVTQTRTCKSAIYGCPCKGESTRTYACPKIPCAVTECCNSYPLVQNFVTNSKQCGLQLHPDPDYTLPSCAFTSTTIASTTTKATATTAGTGTTTTTTTMTTAIAMAPKTCQACTQAELTAKYGGGTAAWEIGGVIVDGATGCNICGWKCNATVNKAAFEVLGTDLTTRIFYDDTYCGVTGQNVLGTFRCSAQGKWQFSNKDLGKYTCNQGPVCATTTTTTTTMAPKNCRSCTHAELNAKYGGGTAAWELGGVIVDGATGCNICGWKCNATLNKAAFEVFGTDLTTRVFYDDTRCGVTGQNVLGTFRCSAQGKWQFSSKDLGKYTCNKGASC